jgi:hypothetical protein
VNPRPAAVLLTPADALRASDPGGDDQSLPERCVISIDVHLDRVESIRFDI